MAEIEPTVKTAGKNRARGDIYGGKSLAIAFCYAGAVFDLRTLARKFSVDRFF